MLDVHQTVWEKQGKVEQGVGQAKFASGQCYVRRQGTGVSRRSEVFPSCILSSASIGLWLRHSFCLTGAIIPILQGRKLKPGKVE